MSDEEDSATGLGICFRALMDMSRILGSNLDCCSQVFVPAPAVRYTAKSTLAHGHSASARSPKFACLDPSEELILRHTRIKHGRPLAPAQISIVITISASDREIESRTSLTTVWWGFFWARRRVRHIWQYNFEGPLRIHV